MSLRNPFAPTVPYSSWAQNICTNVHKAYHVPAACCFTGLPLASAQNSRDLKKWQRCSIVRNSTSREYEPVSDRLAVVKITKALAASQKEKHTISLASAGARKNLKSTISIRSAHNWGRKSFLFFGDQPWRATSITLWGNLSQNCQSKDGKKCEIPDHESSSEELRQLASRPGREMCNFDLRLQNMGSWSSRHKLLAEHVARYVWR
jgi:hypothetical protein